MCRKNPAEKRSNHACHAKRNAGVNIHRALPDVASSPADCGWQNHPEARSKSDAEGESWIHPA